MAERVQLDGTAMCCSYQKSPKISVGNEKTSADFFFFSFFFLIKLLSHYTTRSLCSRAKRSALHSLMGDFRWDGMYQYTKSSLLVLCLSFKDLKIIFFFFQEELNTAVFLILAWCLKGGNCFCLKASNYNSKGRKRCRLRCQKFGLEDS